MLALHNLNGLDKRNSELAAPGSLPSRSTDAISVRKKALFLWESKLSHFVSCSELMLHVAKEVNLDASIIAVWRTMYDWPIPEATVNPRVGSSSSDDQDPDEFDPCDHAEDPLEAFYDELRPGYRRYVSNYIRNAGFLSPCQADLKLVQRLLDRHPITLESVALILCQEPGPFAKYAIAKGVKVPHHSSLDQSIAYLVHCDPHLATVAIRHAQQVYRERSIPIRVTAQRMNLTWQDLWVYGVRYGCWEMPSASQLRELRALVLSRKV